jgi:hypothetical protein
LPQFLSGKKFIISNQRLDSHRLSYSSCLGFIPRIRKVMQVPNLDGKPYQMECTSYAI